MRHHCLPTSVAKKAGNNKKINNASTRTGELKLPLQDNSDDTDNTDDETPLPTNKRSKKNAVNKKTNNASTRTGKF